MASQSMKIWLVIRVRSPGSTNRCEKTDMENLLSAWEGKRTQRECAKEAPKGNWGEQTIS